MYVFSWCINTVPDSLKEKVLDLNPELKTLQFLKINSSEIREELVSKICRTDYECNKCLN
jgi:hypothetical protein